MEVEFEISVDLCREKSHEYDSKLNIDEFIGHFGMPISEKLQLQLIVWGVSQITIVKVSVPSSLSRWGIGLSSGTQ